MNFNTPGLCFIGVSKKCENNILNTTLKKSHNFMAFFFVIYKQAQECNFKSFRIFIIEVRIINIKLLLFRHDDSFDSLKSFNKLQYIFYFWSS